MGTKIVIAAFTEEKLNEAVTYFEEKLKASEGSAELLAEDTVISKAEYEIGSVTVAGAPLSNYKIVYKSGAAASIKNAATYLSEKFAEKYGYIVKAQADGVAETEHEIVICGTNRGDSAEKCDGLNSLDYSVYAEGKRIYILAGANEDTPQKAVDSFLEKLESLIDGGNIKVISENIAINYESDTYLTKDIILNGHPIKEYTIVYKNGDKIQIKLAARLRAAIETICGRRVEMISDSQGYKNGLEILVGSSKRTASGGAAASEFSSVISGMEKNKFVMYGSGSFIYLGGAEDDTGATVVAVGRFISALSDVKDAVAHTVELTDKSAKTINETSYTVITYNDGDNATTKVQEVAAILNQYSADIVGMQEVQRAHVARYESLMPGYKGIYYDHDTYYYGAPIFYKTEKFELIESGTQWLSNTPDKRYSKFEDSDYIRSYVYAIFKDKATGEKFVAINTHVDYVQSANAKQIAVLLECTERFRDLPIFYTGDFNMGNTSSGYKQMIDSGLLDTEAYLGVKKEGTIDFCFVDVDSVIAKDYKVIDDHAYSNTASDHYPILSEIAIVR